jgi:hypothetical protein
VGLDVAADQRADDRLAGRPDREALVELAVAAGLGDPGHLRREALDVLGLLHQQLLRDEEREVPVLVPAGLDHVVEDALDRLPHGEAVRADQHAAAHGRVVGQLGLADHVGVPAVDVDRHPGDVLDEVARLAAVRRHGGLGHVGLPRFSVGEG